MVYIIKLFFSWKIGKCPRSAAIPHGYILELIVKFSETDSVSSRKRINQRIPNAHPQFEIMGICVALLQMTNSNNQ